MRLMQVHPGELHSQLLPGIVARMEAGEWAELRRSVERLGVQVPVLAHYEGEALVLDDGLRRTAAAVIAGLPEIPVLVLDDNDLQRLRDATASERGSAPALALTLLANAVRDRNPIAEYRAIRAMAEHGLTHKEIAEALGVDRSTVSTRLRLDRVLPELLAEAEAGRVPYSVLRRLPSYSEDVQWAVLERVRAGERVRVRDLEELRSAERVDPVDGLAGLAEAVAGLVSPRARAESAVAALREALGQLDLGELYEAAWTGLEAIEAALEHAEEE